MSKDGQFCVGGGCGGVYEGGGGGGEVFKSESKDFGPLRANHFFTNRPSFGVASMSWEGT